VTTLFAIFAVTFLFLERPSGMVDDDPSDAALLAAIQAGSAPAFDRVYARHRPRLYGWLLRMSRRREVAEELSQETWLRFARHALRLPPDTCLRAWLFTVARNLFVSFRRWSILDAGRLFELGRRPPDPLLADPWRSLCRDRSLLALEAGILALPERYREVILLVGVEGFSTLQAAAILKIRPDTLRQRLSRARAMLGEQLARAGHPLPSIAEVAP
jgi:RNA polymerase sigma factor (sigma-70 family)